MFRDAEFGCYTHYASLQDEDTVSLLSRVLYNYLDRIVFHAWRVPSLGVEDMPEVSDQYKGEALRRKSFLVRSRFSALIVNATVMTHFTGS